MPGRGNSTRPTRAEARAGLREQRLEDLLQALVDRPHDRHAVEDVLAELDQLAADEVGGQEAEQRQRRRSAMIRPMPGNLERQIGLGPVGERDERPHQIVDPVDEPPGQADGDGERPDEDQPGQEIVAQAADDAVMDGTGLAARRRCRPPARLARSSDCDRTRSSRSSRYNRTGWMTLPARRRALRYSAKVAAGSLHRDRLGEVARLVDVGAHHDRRVIGDQLHRDGVDEWRHRGGHRRAA